MYPLADDMSKTWGKGKTRTPPLGQGFRTAWRMKGPKFHIGFFYINFSRSVFPEWLDEEIWKSGNRKIQKDVAQSP